MPSFTMTGVTLTYAVLGLGQVGLPLATALAARCSTLGIDLDPRRLDELRRADVPFEVSSDAASLALADVIFVTLPSGSEDTTRFQESTLFLGCQMIARHLRPGSTLIFESTVYPGATEELCIPTIEAVSELKWQKDFFVAYSPERINPGDHEHTLQTIPKLVAADCAETLERVAAIYESIVPAGVHRMSRIRAAELSKVLENVQRDVNIALMNELSMMAQGLALDSAEIIDAAATKWNFLPFRPGLVGGACLGLASHLWAHTHRRLGLGASVVVPSRHINEGVVDFVAHEVLRLLSEHKVDCASARVVQLGASFKADVPSIVESKSVELARVMGQRGMHVWVYDPVADFSRCAAPPFEVCTSAAELPEQWDVLILAVAHRSITERSLSAWCTQLRAGGLVVDLTQRWDAAEVRRLGYRFWRL